MNRRRFLMVSAAGMALGGAAPAVHRLAFRALGADAMLTLPGDQAAAESALRGVQDSVARVERAFSLWNPDSELSRLNRTGRIGASQMFRFGVAYASRMSRLTDGAFDVTVQSLWQAHARGADPVNAMVDWRRVLFDRNDVWFHVPGMAATFNGIAQGLAADIAVRMLTSLGYRDVLANLGEFSGRGARPDGAPWRIGVAAPGSGRIVAEIELTGAAGAVATSEPYGTLIRGKPHIFDPLSRPGPRWASVTVQTRSAAAADALSTAVAAAPVWQTNAILEAGRAVDAVLIAQDGSVRRWPE